MKKQTNVNQCEPLPCSPLRPCPPPQCTVQTAHRRYCFRHVLEPSNRRFLFSVAVRLDGALLENAPSRPCRPCCPCTSPQPPIGTSRAAQRMPQGTKRCPRRYARQGQRRCPLSRAGPCRPPRRRTSPRRDCRSRPAAWPPRQLGAWPPNPPAPPPPPPPQRDPLGRPMRPPPPPLMGGDHHLAQKA